jgi:site-specific DNA-methyltransferase (adenine-specific)
MDEQSGTLMDEQSGTLKSGSAVVGSGSGPQESQTVYSGPAGGVIKSCYADSGGASRFFPTFTFEPSDFEPFRYCAKASKSDRGPGITWPTVKPPALMRWLLKLVVPPGGAVLDPFLGSGTTAVAAIREGFEWIGIEQEAEAVTIAKSRVEREGMPEKPPPALPLAALPEEAGLSAFLARMKLSD